MHPQVQNDLSRLLARLAELSEAIEESQQRRWGLRARRRTGPPREELDQLDHLIHAMRHEAHQLQQEIAHHPGWQ